MLMPVAELVDRRAKAVHSYKNSLAGRRADQVCDRISEEVEVNAQAGVIDSWSDWQRQNPGCVLSARVPLGRNGSLLTDLARDKRDSLEEYIDLARHMVAARLGNAQICLYPGDNRAINRDLTNSAYENVAISMSSVPGAEFSFELTADEQSDGHSKLSACDRSASTPMATKSVGCQKSDGLNILFGLLIVSAGIASEQDMETVRNCSQINRLPVRETITILLGMSVDLAGRIEQISHEIVGGSITFRQGVVAVNHMYLTGVPVRESVSMVKCN